MYVKGSTPRTKDPCYSSSISVRFDGWYDLARMDQYIMKLRRCRCGVHGACSINVDPHHRHGPGRVRLPAPKKFTGASRLTLHFTHARAMHTGPAPSAALLRFLRRQVGHGSNHASAPSAPSQRCRRAFRAAGQPRRQNDDGDPRSNPRNTNLAPLWEQSTRELHGRRPLMLQCQVRSLSSTVSNRAWSWQHLWHKPRDDRDGNGHGLPPLASFFDDSNQGLYRRLKAANEPRLRCTEFDERGNVQLMNGEFKKSELIAKVRNTTLHNTQETQLSHLCAMHVFKVWKTGTDTRSSTD